MRSACTLGFATTLRGEILILALLLFLLTATLAFVTLPTPEGGSFAVDQPQTIFAFRDFYPVERNQVTTFRWSKPASALLVRPEAPGDYRLILTAQGPPGAPPRALVVAVGDTIVGTIQPEVAARDYTLLLRIAPQQWIAQVDHETTVDLRVTPYAPPGDARALGVAVTRVALLPDGPAPATFALAWGGALLLTATAYAALRSIAAAARPALLALGGLIATYGFLALLSRDAALILALLPMARPALAIGVGLGCLLLILISRLWQQLKRRSDTASGNRAPRLALTQHAQHARVELVLLLLLILAFGYFRQEPGWNENSRADLAVALVDERTTRIDRLAGNTEDKAFHAGHYYSDKAPGTALLAALAYGLLRVTGAAGSGTTPAIAAILPTLAFVAAGLPTIVLTLLLRRFLHPRVGEVWAMFVAIGYGLGTIAFPFGTMLFGHAAATFFLFATFFLLEVVRQTVSLSRHWLVALAGCSGGWTILVDFSTAVGIAILVASILLDTAPLRQQVGRVTLFGLGALPPLLILAGYNWVSFGNPLQIGYGNLANEEFAAGMGQGLFGVTLPRLDNLATILVGARGLLLLSPWLIMAPVGLIAAWRYATSRRLVIICAALSVVFLAINAGYFLPLGGWTPGPRFLVPALPFIAILAAFVPRLWRPFVGAQICCAIALTLVATATQPKAPDLVAQPLGMLWLPQLLTTTLVATSAGQRWDWGGIAPLLPLLCAFPIALCGFAARQADQRLWIPVALLFGLLVAFGPVFGL